jgi:hypothetical protein
VLLPEIDFRDFFRFCKVIRVWPWGRCDGRRCDAAAWAGAGVTGYLARGKLGVCEASGPHTTDSKEIIIANFPVRPSVRPHRACHRPPVRIFAPPVRPSVRPFLGRKAKVFPFARPLEQTQAAEFPPHHHPMPFRRSQMRENRCFRRTTLLIKNWTFQGPPEFCLRDTLRSVVAKSIPPPPP